LYVRTNPIHNGDACTQNGTMKHMERLKRVINWACKMDWLPKNPFDRYQLKFKRNEREFLTEVELKAIENKVLVNASMQESKDLFIFSCYTGLAYCDLIELSPDQIAPDTQGRYWIYTNRMKTQLLGVSEALLKEFGAVSSQAAEAMAVGARQRTGATYTLSITGVAGPAKRRCLPTTTAAAPRTELRSQSRRDDIG